MCRREGEKKRDERYVSFTQVVCQHPAQMVQTRLASTVRECFESGDSQSIDTSDVDNTGRVLGRAGALQQRCKESRNVENTVKVQSKDPCPRGRRVFVVWGTPVRSGVIDKNVELWMKYL